MVRSIRRGRRFVGGARTNCKMVMMCKDTATNRFKEWDKQKRQWKNKGRVRNNAYWDAQRREFEARVAARKGVPLGLENLQHGLKLGENSRALAKAAKKIADLERANKPKKPKQRKPKKPSLGDRLRSIAQAPRKKRLRRMHEVEESFTPVGPVVHQLQVRRKVKP